MRKQNGFSNRNMRKKVGACKAAACMTAAVMAAVSVSGCAKEKKNEPDAHNGVSKDDLTGDTAENTQRMSSLDEERRMEPLESSLIIDSLDNYAFAASFNNSDVKLDEDGILNIHLSVYDYELFDMVDVSKLKEGDTLVINGEDILVQTIERDQGVIINGGAEKGGITLKTDVDGTFYEVNAAMEKDYYFVGYVTLSAGEGFAFYDHTGPGNAEQVYDADTLISELNTLDLSCEYTNTSVVVEDGKLIGVIREADFF